MKQVYCKILYNDKVNKGPMFTPKDPEYSLNDLADWVKRNYSSFDKLEINQKTQEVIVTYNNYMGNIFNGDRYEILYFKEVK